MEQLQGFVVLAIVLLVVALWLRRPQSVKVIAIIDGDTVEVVRRSGVRDRVRLIGLDAPELSQKEGQWARSALQHLLGGGNKWVLLRSRGRDRFKRVRGKLVADGRDIALQLLKGGFGWYNRESLRPWERLSYQYAYLAARIARRGIWRSALPPKEPWRARQSAGRFFRFRRWR